MDINKPAAHTGTNLFTAVGTEATTNSVVKIGTRLYPMNTEAVIWPLCGAINKDLIRPDAYR